MIRVQEKQFQVSILCSGSYTIHYKPPGEKYALDLFNLGHSDKERIVSILGEAGYTEVKE